MNTTGERSQDNRRDSILMNVDEAPANFTFLWNAGSGDTGRRRVEHRKISLVKTLQQDV